MLSALKRLFNRSAVILFISAVLLSFFAGHRASKAFAQVPPNYVPCDGYTDNQFHSLRPYQKSPCGERPGEEPASDLALFCGNQLVMQDTVSANPEDCVEQDNGLLRCTVEKPPTEISIDLSGADLPILGNTEDVINSQQRSVDIADATKVNEYASWYLSGTPNKAEYPYLSISDEDVQKLIDYSGPLNKLLPLTIQNAVRKETVEKAIAGEERHDQIVACKYDITVSQRFGIKVGGFPVPCYMGLGTEILLESVGDITPLRTSSWKKHLPPLETEIGDKYENYDEYWQAYQKWQGKFCPLIKIPETILGQEIPLIGGKTYLLMCGLENPFSPNYYANLYQNIPLASTEDKKGLVSTDTITVQPTQEGVEIKDVRFTNQEPAELFFAHAAEVAELTSLLQNTYLPDGLSSTGGISNISPSDYGACDLANIRSNPGDDLFAGEIRGELSYTAEFECEPQDTINCFQECVAEGNSYPECRVFPVCSPEELEEDSLDCSKPVSVGLSLVTETPKADEIWDRTVAGSASVFKRIFPKIGIGGPILGLLDMPAATKVTYQSPNGNVLAGNPGNQRDGESAELYFPHFGGVEEYFLKGIQTILRPQGFGEQILSGEPGTIASSGEINCNINAPEISVNRLIDKESAHQLALNWVGGQAGNHVLECYNDTVGRARSSGVNTALTMWTWLHESGGSNYNFRPNVLDFGSIAAPPENFNEQIESFIRTAKSRNSNSPQCAGASVTDIEAYAYIFATGTCDPNAVIDGTDGQTARDFYNEMVNQWSLVTNCPFPSSPTDTSCP